MSAVTVQLYDAEYFCLLCQAVHTYLTSDEFASHRDQRQAPVRWIYREVEGATNE